MDKNRTLWPVIRNHSPDSNYLMGIFSQLQVQEKVVDNKIICSKNQPTADIEDSQVFFGTS